MTAPITPIDQIFNGEWVEEIPSPHMSSDVDEYIRGLGQDLPDAADDGSSEINDVEHGTIGNATGDPLCPDGPKIHDLQINVCASMPDDLNATNSGTIPVPSAAGSVDIINSLMFAKGTVHPHQFNTSIPHGRPKPSKLVTLSKSNGKVYSGVQRKFTTAARPKLFQGDTTPEQVERLNTLSHRPQLHQREPAPKKRRVDTQLRPRTRSGSQDRNGGLKPAQGLEVATSETRNPILAQSVSLPKPSNTALTRQKPTDESTHIVEKATLSEDRAATNTQVPPAQPKEDQLNLRSRRRSVHRKHSSSVQPTGHASKQSVSQAPQESSRGEPPSGIDKVVVESSSHESLLEGTRVLHSPNRSDISLLIDMNQEHVVFQPAAPAEDFGPAQQYFDGHSSPSVPTSDNEAGSAEVDQDERRFFGQMRNLNTAFKAVRELGLKKSGLRRFRYKIPSVQTARVEELVKSLCKAEETIKADNEESQDEQIGETVRDTSKHAMSVVGHDDWNSTELFEDIYLHVLPKLARLLQTLVEYYKSSSDAELSYPQLQTLRRVMVTICAIGDEARKSQPQPELSLEFPVKNLVNNKIVVTIRSALRRFETKMRNLRQENVGIENSAAHVQRHQLQERLVGRDQKNKRALREWRLNWQILHVQRRGAELEGQISLGPKKDLHLKMTPLDPTAQEVGRVEGSQDPAWDDDEHTSLLSEGLRAFHGPNVYRDIFRTYCKRHDPLEAYNVSQILQQASWLRTLLIEDAQSQGAEAEQWILDIVDPRIPPALEEV